MTIAYRLMPDGGFVCGDTETQQTGYAYRSSPHATMARKRAARVAADMIRSANAYWHDARSVQTQEAVTAYNDRMWAWLGEAV